MKRTEARRKLEEIQNEYEVENRASNINRARSITVGTAFGGATEVMMRSDGGRHIWCVMQPVEVIELIHQLSANVGCTADLKPRRDFASWRDWRLTDEERKHYGSHPPFANDMAQFHELGANMKKYHDIKLLEKINEVIKQHNGTPSENSNSFDLPKSNLTPSIEDMMQDQMENTLNSSISNLVDGAPNVGIDPVEGLLNKVIPVPEDGSTIILGGAGGNTEEREEQFKRKL